MNELNLWSYMRYELMVIPNFSRYCADSEGDLFSRNYKRTGRFKILKPAKSIDGYLKTMLLGDDGKYHTTTVHKLVACAFIGEKTKGFEVNHKDGNKTNNKPDNLEYVSRSENIKHAYDNGLITPKAGILNGNSKLNDYAVKTIREHAKNSGRYYGRKELAQRFGISEAHVKDIVNSKTLWIHV